MAETILQTFLNNQFIKTSDTGNIDSLAKAVTAVKKLLTNKKHLVIPYTLVALDPQINDTDPIVVEVERLIIKNWTTFKNSISTEDKATTYVRVVILQALADISNNEEYGAIIWLTGRNVISYYKLRKEIDPLSEMLINIASQYEINSRRYWSIVEPDLKEIEELKVSLPPIKSNPIDEGEMITLFKRAAIYKSWKDQANVGGIGENPSYAGNGDWHWENFFSEKVGGDLTEVLNTTAVNQDKSLNTICQEIQKGVNEYFAHVKDFFSEFSQAMRQSAEANNKRSDLLWWKQTLYSPVLNDSYRKQSIIASAVVMAYDLSQLIGNLYPESVNYLLREALYDVHGEIIDEEQEFGYWIALEGNDKDICKSVLALLGDDSEGRKSLSTAFANILHDKTSSFTEQTGIEANSKITPSDLAVWILHDLQAKKISLIK